MDAKTGLIKTDTLNAMQDQAHRSTSAAIGAKFVQKGCHSAVTAQEQKVANILSGYAKSGGGKRIMEALENKLASNTMLKESEKLAAKKLAPEIMQKAGVKATARLSNTQSKNMVRHLGKLAAMKGGEKVLHGVVNGAASTLAVVLMWDDLKKMKDDIVDEYDYLTAK